MATNALVDFALLLYEKTTCDTTLSTSPSPSYTYQSIK